MTITRRRGKGRTSLCSKKIKRQFRGSSFCVARDLLQTRNLSTIWILDRSLFLLRWLYCRLSGQRSRHCSKLEEWMFWFPWMRRVAPSTAPRAVHRFSSEISLLTMILPPTLGPPLSTVALVGSSRSKRKGIALEDESRTSFRSCRWIITWSIDRDTPNGSSRPASCWIIGFAWVVVSFVSVCWYWKRVIFFFFCGQCWFIGLRCI